MRYTTQKGWRPGSVSRTLNIVMADIKAGNIETMYLPRSVLGAIGELAQSNITKEHPFAHMYIGGVMIIVEDDSGS